MGYTTDFTGEFDISPAIQEKHERYLIAFNETRRMARNEAIAQTLPDPIRNAVGLPIGEEGCFFVGGQGFMGQQDDESIIDRNYAPGEERNRYSRTEPLIPAKENGQPGLWCQWTVATSQVTGKKVLEWDGGEKFYHYVKWLVYIMKNFLVPWGYTLNGKVTWQGEDSRDKGIIEIRDNNVVVTYESPNKVEEYALKKNPTVFTEPFNFLEQNES